MEYRENNGVFYSNERLGVKRAAHQLNAHFYEEGQEKRVIAWDEPAWEVGIVDDPYWDKKLGFQRRYVVFDNSPGTVINIASTKIVYDKDT